MATLEESEKLPLEPEPFAPHSESESDLEAERERKIAANRELLRQLELDAARKDLVIAGQKPKPPRTPRIRAEDGTAFPVLRRDYPRRERKTILPAVETRTAKRQRKSQRELSSDSESDTSSLQTRPSRGQSYSFSTTGATFGEEHVKALGVYNNPFVQNYSEEYLKPDSTTCHQCRQKITGPKSECSACNTMRGQFCGKCLFNRYGENLFELPESWACPSCRGICNCSFCYRATGCLVSRSRKSGYLSAGHMIILENLEGHLECDEVQDTLVVTNRATGAVIRTFPRYRRGPLPAVEDTAGPACPPPASSEHPFPASPVTPVTRRPPETPETPDSSPEQRVEPSLTSKKAVSYIGNKLGRIGEIVAVNPESEADKYWLAISQSPLPKSAPFPETVKVRWLDATGHCRYKESTLATIPYGSILMRDVGVWRSGSGRVLGLADRTHELICRLASDDLSALEGFHVEIPVNNAEKCEPGVVERVESDGTFLIRLRSGLQERVSPLKVREYVREFMEASLSTLP
eukprot:TRINITY_DN42969_c0_g1_i1.p1 TRINITY_DN42969_c0_g1~~TRINITY_DN42969_c0_g1_i1.p1  ORF type:complete len:521 (-),score=52.36 TRINITY_DN42969_c0_g1_i1:76-1638(-)